MVIFAACICAVIPLVGTHISLSQVRAGMLNEELCLEARFSLYHSRDGTAAHPCRGCTNPSIIFLLRPPHPTLLNRSLLTWPVTWTVHRWSKITSLTSCEQTNFMHVLWWSTVIARTVFDRSKSAAGLFNWGFCFLAVSMETT